MARGAIVTLFSQTANGAVANVTAERTITAAGVGSLTIPARFLEVGTSIRILARGTWSNVAVPTRRWRIKLGGTLVLDTLSNQMPKDVTTEPWAMEAVLVSRTVGASGSVIGAGSVASISVHRDFDPATGVVAIDTTKALALDITCQWGTANAGNVVTCTHLLVWAEQPI
jgi:hypothetical protein